jgi:diguanylate cyclase (GGDEF)-like protein
LRGGAVEAFDLRPGMAGRVVIGGGVLRAKCSHVRTDNTRQMAVITMLASPRAVAAQQAAAACELPAVMTACQTMLPHAAHIPNAAHARPRLLAIDESMDTHRLLKSSLKAERVEIHGATTGEQGLRSARTMQPDVILLSVELPDMHGFTALEQLKADAATHDIPVIFLSSSAQTQTIVRGLDMGAIDFVGKPFDISELKARVRCAIRIRMLIRMLAQRAQIDGLTGLWNRAHFDQRLHEEASAAVRHSAPLALVLIDLDDFKSINDTHGHPIGDLVLEEFGRLLSRGRAADIACRYGGEEFAIILPRTGAEDARCVAERLREDVRGLRWEEAPGMMVTASFGVADLASVAGVVASVHAGSSPIERALVETADAALYRAKTGGRDRVVVAERSEGHSRAIA